MPLNYIGKAPLKDVRRIRESEPGLYIGLHADRTHDEEIVTTTIYILFPLNNVLLRTTSSLSQRLGVNLIVYFI